MLEKQRRERNECDTVNNNRGIVYPLGFVYYVKSLNFAVTIDFYFLSNKNYAKTIKIEW